MRVLVIGSGAREHALIWKLHQSPEVTEVLAAPGNAGISLIARTAAVAATDVAALRQLATNEKVDLTIVGPEDPLAAGVVDEFQRAGLAVFGPTQAAARIEWSKVWAKEVLEDAGVPVARFAAAETPDEVRARAREFGLPVVLKADGLAVGKGTVVCRATEEIERTIDEFMVQRIHGASGLRIEVEEYLAGPELSAFALVDGSHFLPMLPARDHKPLLDGNLGPNTGGMGGYARPADATPELMEEINQRIFAPTVKALADLGCPYVGVLYAGLILTPSGPRVIEFNSRWGDPEAQLLLPLLDTDLVELSLACIEGRLDRTEVRWKDGVTLGVGLASQGYPATSRKGDPIEGLNQVDGDVHVFHHATRFAENRPDVFLTDGGRILTVVAVGRSLAEARVHAYDNVERIRFAGMQYRRDLGAEGSGIMAPRPTSVQTTGERQ